MVKIYEGTLLNYMKGHVMSELARLYIMLSCPSSFDIVKRGLKSAHIPFQNGTYRPHAVRWEEARWLMSADVGCQLPAEATEERKMIKTIGAFLLVIFSYQ